MKGENTVSLVLCKKCGKHIYDSETICPYCGVSLIESAEERSDEKDIVESTYEMKDCILSVAIATISFFYLSKKRLNRQFMVLEVISTIFVAIIHAAVTVYLLQLMELAMERPDAAKIFAMGISIPRTIFLSSLILLGIRNKIWKGIVFQVVSGIAYMVAGVALTYQLVIRSSMGAEGLVIANIVPVFILFLIAIITNEGSLKWFSARRTE